MTRKYEPTNPHRPQKKEKGKTVYPSMRMIRRVRHWMSKPVKAVFDAESNPNLMDSDIGEKARLSGLSVKQYKEALAELNNSLFAATDLFYHRLYLFLSDTTRETRELPVRADLATQLFLPRPPSIP